MVHIDRRIYLASLGGTAAVKMMSLETKAEALESYMIQRSNTPAMRTIAMPDNLL